MYSSSNDMIVHNELLFCRLNQYIILSLLNMNDRENIRFNVSIFIHKSIHC
uniref:Uncharacterized protein n=1 Tax=Anguilla anguilla TaxID=7936 RepID=A0A0E9QAQ9_ANGAN